MTYRRSQPLPRSISKAIGADQWNKKHAARMAKAKKSIKTTDMRGRGILLEMKSGLDMAVLPFRNLAEVMPFGKIIFSTDWKARFVARAEEFERERGARVAQAEKALSDESFRTIR